MTALFQFKPADTIFHRLDPRCKFLIICLLGTSLISAGWTATGFITLLLLFVSNHLGTSPLNLAGNLKYFLLLLGLIIVTQSFTVQGQPMFSLFGYECSVDGAIQGSLVALRFFTVMVLGLIFCQTTSPSELTAAIKWLLKPVPFIPEQRAAMVISLSLRFLPMIINQGKESALAFDARCGNRIKNPLRRIRILATALLCTTFKKADHLAAAMESRAYTETARPPQFNPSGKEPVALTLTTCLTLLSLFY